MNSWKNFKKLQKVTGLSGSAVFMDIVNTALKNGNLIGLLIYGSSAESEYPNDIDVLIVLSEGKRRFEILLDQQIPIEIEYVPKNFLFSPLTNFHWYTENWEFEIAKYVYGEVIYDPFNLLREFRAKASSYPIEIARYLFLHRIGRCTYMLRKLRKHANIGYVTSFINMLILACLAMERKIPKKLNSFDFLSEKYKRIIEWTYYSMESIDESLFIIAKEGFKLLELDKLLKEKRLDKLKFWYPAEVEGLRLLIRKENRTYSWPEVIHLENL